MNIKGARDITTTNAVAHGPQRTSRARAARELALLEQQKDQLERELKMWVNNQKRAERRLGPMQERIALLQRVVGESFADHPPSSADKGSGDGRRQAAATCREVTLEY